MCAIARALSAGKATFIQSTVRSRVSERIGHDQQSAPGLQSDVRDFAAHSAVRERLSRSVECGLRGRQNFKMAVVSAVPVPVRLSLGRDQDPPSNLAAV